MPRRKRSRQTIEPKPEGETVTFSTRLTEEQRERVVKAADLKGWTPSNLIRIAALEKSAHIINTATRTKFDFSGLAQRIARQLVKVEIGVRIPHEDSGLEDLTFEQFADQFAADNDTYPAEAYTAELSAEELETFRSAARLGGSDFLNLIVEACESRLAPDRADLPKPVDPSS